MAPAVTADSEATICGDNDAHFSSPVEQHDGLPSINSMTPLSEVRPQHVRRHSSLRHEYHPLSPSAEDTAHERKLNESINGIGSWTSPTANFSQPPFTQDNNVSCEQYNRDQSTASSLMKGHIHSASYQSPNTNGGFLFSPLQYTPPHMLQYPRDRSASAPMAPQTSTQQQLALTPTSSIGKSNGIISQKHKHRISSPSSHSLSQFSHAPASPSPSPRPARKQIQTDDDGYLKALIAAMGDMTSTEDNPGMLDTWRKIMKTKIFKIERICRDMLDDILKVNRQGGEPLGEKRPVYVYKSFKERFDAICNALRTQKSVCKRLLEDPYVYQVVDDPVYALKRVQNNRRVNQQKKEAIEEGRKSLGVRGRGKGVSLQQASGSEGQSEADEDELSARDLESEQENEQVEPTRSSRPRRAATKRQYAPVPDEDDPEDSVEAPTPPKKTKRNVHRRSQSAVEKANPPPPQQPALYGSSNDAFTSSAAPIQEQAYAPTAERHSTGSSFNLGYSTAPYSHTIPSHHTSHYNFDGLPANRYGNMRPMLIADVPSFSQPYGSQDPQSSSSGTYSENVSPVEVSPNVPKFYDPFVN